MINSPNRFPAPEPRSAPKFSTCRLGMSTWREDTNNRQGLPPITTNTGTLYWRCWEEMDWIPRAKSLSWCGRLRQDVVCAGSEPFIIQQLSIPTHENTFLLLKCLYSHRGKHVVVKHGGLIQCRRMYFGHYHPIEPSILAMKCASQRMQWFWRIYMYSMLRC